jgi:hypothetical protein
MQWGAYDIFIEESGYNIVLMHIFSVDIYMFDSVSYASDSPVMKAVLLELCCLYW